jgi:hypothetical protein
MARGIGAVGSGRVRRSPQPVCGSCLERSRPVSDIDLIRAIWAALHFELPLPCITMCWHHGCGSFGRGPKRGDSGDGMGAFRSCVLSRRHVGPGVAIALVTLTTATGSLMTDVSQASVSAGTGDVQLLSSVPAGVQECGTTGIEASENPNCLSSSRSSHKIFAFDELQNFVLPSNLVVDLGPRSPGWALNKSYSSESQVIGPTPTAYSLLAGDTISSHLLHADLPFSDPATTFSDRAGTATFSSPILGLIFIDAGLASSDSLGAPGTVYPTSHSRRGLEFDCVGHSVFNGSLCSDAYNNGNTDALEASSASTLAINFSVAEKMDQVRVITDVPDVPAIGCPGPVTVDKGSAAHATGGTFSDGDSFATVTLSASRGSVTSSAIARSGSWTWDYTPPEGTTSGAVEVTAQDDTGRTSTCSFQLNVIGAPISKSCPPYLINVTEFDFMNRLPSSSVARVWGCISKSLLRAHVAAVKGCLYDKTSGFVWGFDEVVGQSKTTLNTAINRCSSIAHRKSKYAYGNIAYGDPAGKPCTWRLSYAPSNAKPFKKFVELYHAKTEDVTCSGHPGIPPWRRLRSASPSSAPAPLLNVGATRVSPTKVASDVFAVCIVVRHKRGSSALSNDFIGLYSGDKTVASRRNAMPYVAQALLECIRGVRTSYSGKKYPTAGWSP